jgi:hypothetical protein
MAQDASLRRAIARAERLLPGRPVPRGLRDPRWQAIIRVGNFIETHPVEVCEFALKWMRRARGFDLPAALYCCLVEHLLEHHFDIVLPMFRKGAFANARVAQYFYPYRPHFQFGQARTPKNVALQKRLARELEHHADERKKRQQARKRNGEQTLA